MSRFSLVFASILTISLAFAISKVNGQSIEIDQVSIRDFFENLNKKGYQVFYSNDVIDDTRLVGRKLLTYQSRFALKILAEQYNVDFEIRGNEIFIVPKLVRRATLSGRVFDQSDGEALFGVNVVVKNTKTGVVSNAYGFYAISLDVGTYELTFSHIGYRPLVLPIDLNTSKKLDVKLYSDSTPLEEVVFVDRDFDFEFRSLETGVNKLDMSATSEIPYLLGEVDAIQASLLLPGIRNIGEDASGLNIRGGSVDQNLILLDEATVYNSNHFYGFISVFNPDAVKDVVIYKGGIPSNYGGRASSAILVRQKEGNNQETKVSGGIGLVSGRIMVEGPIKKDTSSFLISTRTSLLNYIAAISADPVIRNSSTNFQDLNAKVNFRPNFKNHIYISTYVGQDNSSDQILFNRRWGNRAFTLRWNKIFSDKLFSNFTLTNSNYNYKINNPDGVGEFFEESTVSDYTAKIDYAWFISPKWQIEFGLGTTYHHLRPGDRIPIDEDDIASAVQLDSEDGIIPYLYGNLQYTINDKLLLNAGIRQTALINFGPDEVYQYLPNQSKSNATRVDTISYGKFAHINTHHVTEPRLSLTYQLNNVSSFKLSYNKSAQFIHLLSNTIIPAPTDIWKLSDQHISPTVADHVGVGFYKKWRDTNTDFFVEGYYKKLDNIIEYREGANLLFNESIETELLQGESRAYGLEFLLRKNFGKFSGWISYNLSNTERQVNGLTDADQINGGSYYPSDFDRRHDLSFTGIYKTNTRWSFSGNFLFATGRPITLPDGKYQFEGFIIPSFSERNQFRLSNYHRLDINATLQGKKFKKSGEERKNRNAWVFTLFNVYAQRNAYSYLFRQKAGSQQTEVVKYSILGSIIPSVTYNFSL